MLQKAFGILGCLLGLGLAFSHGGLMGVCIIALSLAVFNGLAHDAWMSFDMSGDDDFGDGSDGADGGGGDGGGGGD